jgi:hypothetical protein
MSINEAINGVVALHEDGVPVLQAIEAVKEIYDEWRPYKDGRKQR